MLSRDIVRSTSMVSKNNNNKAAIGHNGTNSWSNVNSWLRQRTLGKNKPSRMPPSLDLINNLKLEASLYFGPRGNRSYPIDWNQQGDLLAGARSDSKVVVWDVFKRREKCLVETGHAAPISSIKFMPTSNDTRVITLSDFELRLTNFLNGRNSFLCNAKNRDHFYRVNNLAVHPSEPNLIWIVGDDGLLSQYDLRQSHECDHYYLYQAALECMAINPFRSEILAVADANAYTCLYDRRALKFNSPSPCISHFAHIYRSESFYNRATDLAFNSDGSELLTTVGNSQIYLFKTYESEDKYQSFDISIKPLLTDESELKTCAPINDKPYPYLNQLRKQCPVEMQGELKTLCNDLFYRTSRVRGPKKIIDHINKSLDKGVREAAESIERRSNSAVKIIDYLNVLLEGVTNCPDLYRSRAIALTARDWSGDSYQAMRDCCSALALNPLDFQTIRCLSATLVKIGNEEDVRRLLDFVEASIKEFGDNNDLARSREMLRAFKKCNSNLPIKKYGLDLDLNYTTASDHPSDLFHVDVHSQKCTKPFDYSRRYRNKLKTFSCLAARFFGGKDEYVVGSDENGALYVWDKNTTNIMKKFHSRDLQVRVLPHPSICMLASSGWGETVEFWSPISTGERRVYE